MSQGVSRVTTTFEKNIFVPNEMCKAIVSIDNSQCNLSIQNVRLALEQELVLTTGGHTFRHTYTLTN
jgi:sporulation-control protein spo0M